MRFVLIVSMIVNVDISEEKKINLLKNLFVNSY